jgi:hypothetical protein
MRQFMRFYSFRQKRGDDAVQVADGGFQNVHSGGELLPVRGLQVRDVDQLAHDELGQGIATAGAPLAGGGVVIQRQVAAGKPAIGDGQ